MLTYTKEDCQKAVEDIQYVIDFVRRYGKISVEYPQEFEGTKSNVILGWFDGIRLECSWYSDNPENCYGLLMVNPDKDGKYRPFDNIDHFKFDWHVAKCYLNCCETQSCI